MKTYIIFGPPGAGKGTQASLIVEKYNLLHISTGELLRSEIRSGSELGKRAAELIDKGCLVPDEDVESMISAKYDQNKDVDGFLLDGFPRTVAQAEVLERMLERRGESVTGVISLMIPDETVKERIRHRAMVENRIDDTKDEIIENRIHEYHSKTEPVADYYKAEGKYIEIDGVGSIEDVFAKICEIL